MHILLLLKIVYFYLFRFFPIREGMKTVEVEDIWKLLYKHVHNHYPSLKQAFLEIDAVCIIFIQYLLWGHRYFMV